MVPPGKVQVPGFKDSDSHIDVITKGAKGLGITTSPHRLSLIVSNGLVKDNPLSCGNLWTLGGYTAEFGGSKVRAKRTFGIYVPPDEIEDEDELHQCWAKDVKVQSHNFLKYYEYII